MDTRPIGVFDSGLGGVSTLIRARALLPGETFLYYGDCGNAPYGNRSEEEIQQLTLAACQKLADCGAKALLIACNTATAAAYGQLREAFSIPVVGMEPAVAEAARARRNGLVLLLATEATIALINKHGMLTHVPDAARVRGVPCPAEIVRRVERGIFEMDGYDDLLSGVLTPYAGELVDGIVLGCTHYVFLQPQIARYAARHFMGTPRFFEGGEHAVLELKTMLEEQSLLYGEGDGSVQFYTSGNDAAMRPLFARLLAQSISF